MFSTGTTARHEKSRNPKCSIQRSSVLPVTGKILSRIILWIGIVLFSFIGLGSLLFTTFYPSYTEQAEYLTNASWPVIILSAAAIVVVALLSRLHVLERIGVKLLSWILGCYMIVMSMAWAIASNTFPAWDSADLILAARQLGSDDMFMWNGWYMERYPYQMPYVMIIRLLTHISGVDNVYIALEFLNALCSGAAALLLVRFACQLFGNKAAVMSGLFSFFFLPLFLYSTFAYGNLPSFPFAIAALLWQAKFMKTGKWRYMVCAAPSITISILLKSTMIVVLIAMCLVLLVSAIGKRKLRDLVAVVLPLVVYATCSHGFFAMMEQRYGVETGNGLGKTTWIAMGLQGDVDGNPLPGEPDWNGKAANAGWYNMYPWGWKDNYDPAVAAQDSAESIKRSLTHFMQDPKFAAQYMAQKQATVWFDPTYESMLSSNWSESAPNQNNGVPMATRPMTKIVHSAYYGKINAAIIRISDVFQFLTLAACVAALVKMRKRFELEQLLPITVGLGVFCIYLLWEAKAQYAMPAYVMLLVYSGQGLLAIADVSTSVIGKAYRAIAGKRNQVPVRLTP